MMGLNHWKASPLIDWPDQATFLRPEERLQLQYRLQNDASRGVAWMDHFDRPAFMRIVFDWKINIAYVDQPYELLEPKTG